MGNTDVQPKRLPRAARPRKAVMEVTEAAAQRIKELMEQKDPKPHGIRLGVRTRGYVPVLSCVAKEAGNLS